MKKCVKECPEYRIDATGLHVVIFCAALAVGGGFVLWNTPTPIPEPTLLVTSVGVFVSGLATIFGIFGAMVVLAARSLFELKRVN